ncbi:GTPase obg domain protein [Mycobacterium kansasii 662]|uniref:GTPase obg domain protein n=1 Tax=Mycobacterium kansasii 662 TaxID=1299326 RepID=X7XNA9_MYCKA|nr:GTPase obg domain protein [Mycobacterium kansasii 662]
MLVHVVDCATNEPGRDPISDIDALEAELAAYTPTLRGDSVLDDLTERPRAVVLNKIDVPEARELAEFVRDEIAQRGWPVFLVSTVTRENLQPLIFGCGTWFARYHAARPQVVPRRPVIRPVPVDDSGFDVQPDGRGGFVVTGARPETLDRADRLRQRRGRRLSRGPPGAPGCRRSADPTVVPTGVGSDDRYRCPSTPRRARRSAR